MKKFIVTIAIGCVAAVCALCGCTPEPVTLWCGSPISNANFSFKYSAANSAYDGFCRSFYIKDEEKFIEFLTELDGYAGTMQYADNAEKQVYTIVKDGEVFVCYSKNGDGYYRMHLSSYCIEGNYFYYPHAEDYWNYDFELDYSGVNTYVTTTVQNWEYFKAFYSHIDGAVADDVTTTVTFQNVTLTVGDGEVTWTIDYGEK